METTTKPNFKELAKKYDSGNVKDIETLIKAVYRYNEDLMEDCNENYDIAKNAEKLDVTKNISTLYKMFAEDTQQKTFEIEVMLKMILEKLKPFFDVENDFHQIEKYLSGTKTGTVKEKLFE